jgi:hypothetical protein
MSNTGMEPIVFTVQFPLVLGGVDIPHDKDVVVQVAPTMG